MNMHIDAYQMHEVNDAELEQKWQNYLSSGMPELIKSFHLCHVIHAIAECGIAQKLASNDWVEKRMLIAGVDRHLGEHLMRYLIIEGIAEERGTTVRATARARSMLDEVALAQFYFYFEAYGPVTRSAGRLLSGKARYGHEVLRDGEALGRHSGTMFKHFYTPIVLQTIRDYNARVVLDIGCGGGRSLVDACKLDRTLRGVGLDISEPAIRAARELARSEGVGERVTFVVGDAFRPSTWPDECLQAEMITAVGVMHEHFRDGEDAVVELLNVFADFLLARTMLLGEPELYYDGYPHDSDFYLAHILTNQGFPRRRADWLKLLARTNLKCRRVIQRPAAGQRLAFFDLTGRT